MSTAKPSGTALFAAYTRYFMDRTPCEDGRINNQCAVRLSVAMVRCGFSIRDQDFSDPRRIHRGRRACGIPEDHVCGAKELADALVRLWGPGAEYRDRTVGLALANMIGRWGIVYFNNCFTRSGQQNPTGDHIDLWDGHRYMNQRLAVGAGGNAGAQTDLFSRSANRGYYIRFFALSA
jgi:hypothetical protein